MPDGRWSTDRPDLSHLADAADTRPRTAWARSVVAGSNRTCHIAHCCSWPRVANMHYLSPLQ
jgi:hypothetical protein